MAFLPPGFPSRFSLPLLVWEDFPYFPSERKSAEINCLFYFPRTTVLGSSTESKEFLDYNSCWKCVSALWNYFQFSLDLFLCFCTYINTLISLPTPKTERPNTTICRARIYSYTTPNTRTLRAKTAVLVELFLGKQGCTVRGSCSFVPSAVPCSSQQASRSTLCSLAAVSVVVFCLLIGAQLAAHKSVPTVSINHIFQALPVRFSPRFHGKGEIFTLIHQYSAASTRKTFR